MKKKVRAAYIVAMGDGLESFVFREVEESLKRGIDITLYATTYRPGDIYSPKDDWDFEIISYTKALFALVIFILTKPLTTLSMIFESIRFQSLIELLIALDYSIRMKKKAIDHIHCVFGDRKFFIGCGND